MTHEKPEMRPHDMQNVVVMPTIYTPSGETNSNFDMVVALDEKPASVANKKCISII